MKNRLHRRQLLGLAVATGLAAIARPVRAQTEAVWSFPISRAGQVPGDGFFIKHGYGCENPAYYPGLTHTGENWYGIEENAAGADVIAVAAGEVVYADYDYPGRVVIVQHEPALFSMYGHLDYVLAVAVGDRVERGDRIGTVLARSDEFARSHLHLEIRTFLFADRVNGEHPQYRFSCGYNCPPGPGYWPLDAPEHPSQLGWLNPTHAIARRLYPSGVRDAGASVTVSSSPSAPTTALWSAPPWRDGARQVRVLDLVPGERFPLLEIATGADDSTGRNANAYRLWFRIEIGGELSWVQAAKPSTIDRGLDGEPSAALLDLLPVI